MTSLRFSLAPVLFASVLAACQLSTIEGSGEQEAGGSDGSTVGAGGSADATTVARDAGFSLWFSDGGGASDTGAPASSDDRSCSGEVHQGKVVPVDLLFLIDTSGSMEESGGAKSKWMSLREAITRFVMDPLSAGLGVGLMRFPAPPKLCTKNGECGGGDEFCGRKGACSPPAEIAVVEPACYTGNPICMPCTAFGLCSQSGLRCTAVGQMCDSGMPGDVCRERPRFCTDFREASCALAHYQTPVVPIAELPGVRPALEDALAAIVPEGGTPTTPAVKGALAYLRPRANGERKQLLVLATDGMPSLCAPNTVDTAAAVLKAAQAASPGIPTYVVGIFSGAQLMRAQPALEQLAAAGGTGTPFILTTGGDLAQKFHEAINQIRASARTCEFTIPKPTSGMIDYDKVNVRITTAAANQNPLYVGSADRCDSTRGGWHYDVDPKAGTPARVLLCPASCTQTKASLDLAVDLRFGCKSSVAE